MKFKPGDICVVRTCPIHPHRAMPGHQTTILSVDPIRCKDRPYETDIPPGPGYVGPFKHCWGCDTCFELKNPPAMQREEAGDWALCPWRPKEVEKRLVGA